MVSIRKFQIIVLVSNRIEYWSFDSILNFEYSHSTSIVKTAYEHVSYGKADLTIFGLKGGLTLHSSNASQSILSLKNGWTRIARSPPWTLTQPSLLTGLFVMNYLSTINTSLLYHLQSPIVTAYVQSTSINWLYRAVGELHSAIGLSLLQARWSGTHYQLSFTICLSVLMVLGALLRRYYSRDISASSAIEMYPWYCAI